MTFSPCLYLKNGVIFRSPRFPIATYIRSAVRSSPRRNLVSPPAFRLEASLKAPSFSANSFAQRLPDFVAMNAQQIRDLLTLQHLLGLEGAATSSTKLKPKELQRLQSLKQLEPVFLCVDLEAWEMDQSKVTEVGISSLDTRNLVGTDPGHNGSNWFRSIKTRHIIIQEHKRFVNGRFVHGCPDKFNFGQSESVSLYKVSKLLNQIFDDPSPETKREQDQDKRKIILVGHGLSNDTAYLQTIRFKPHAGNRVAFDIDTQKIVGTKRNTVGLNRMLAGLGLEAQNLHNAGNDAHYTMQGLVSIVVQHTKDPGGFVQPIANAKKLVSSAKSLRKEKRQAQREALVKMRDEKPEEPRNNEMQQMPPAQSPAMDKTSSVDSSSRTTNDDETQAEDNSKPAQPSVEHDILSLSPYADIGHLSGDQQDEKPDVLKSTQTKVEKRKKRSEKVSSAPSVSSQPSAEHDMLSLSPYADIDESVHDQTQASLKHRLDEQNEEANPSKPVQADIEQRKRPKKAKSKPVISAQPSAEHDMSNPYSYAGSNDFFDDQAQTSRGHRREDEYEDLRISLPYTPHSFEDQAEAFESYQMDEHDLHRDVAMDFAPDAFIEDDSGESTARDFMSRSLLRRVASIVGAEATEWHDRLHPDDSGTTDISTEEKEGMFGLSEPLPQARHSALVKSRSPRSPINNTNPDTEDPSPSEPSIQETPPSLPPQPPTNTNFPASHSDPKHSGDPSRPFLQAEAAKYRSNPLSNIIPDASSANSSKSSTVEIENGKASKKTNDVHRRRRRGLGKDTVFAEFSLDKS